MLKVLAEFCSALILQTLNNLNQLDTCVKFIYIFGLIGMSSDHRGCRQSGLKIVETEQPKDYLSLHYV